MAVNALPLLHKYVLSPTDDKDLTLAKLRYRLCVQEVCEVLHSRSQAKRFESAQATAADDDSFRLHPMKWEDSGIGTDESISEDLRSPQHHDIFRTTEELSTNDISRQPESLSEDTFHPEASSSLSSSSSSSDSCDESEEMGKPCFYSRNGENFDNGENNGAFEFYENNYDEAKEDVAATRISSCLANKFESLREEDEGMEISAFVPLMCSTLESGTDQSTHDISPLDKNPPVSTIQGQDDDTKASPKNLSNKCTDVDEALRILMTRNELPHISARKAVTWSWNAVDLVRAPQKIEAAEKGPQESQAKRNPSNQLRATHEKILSRDKKLADLYRKIKERDEEDQRMVQELLKKQTIPYAEPLPAVAPPKPSPERIENPRPQVEKEEILDMKPKEGSSTTKTLPRAEEPVRKKKHGNVLQNVVHSLQRRFSKRNRETTTSA